MTNDIFLAFPEATRTFLTEFSERHTVELIVDPCDVKTKDLGRVYYVRTENLAEAVEGLMKLVGEFGKARIGAWGMTLLTVKGDEVIYQATHARIEEFRNYWGR